MSLGVIINGFFKENGGEVYAGIVYIFWQSKQKSAVATADIKDGGVCWYFCQKRFEIRPDIATGGGEIATDLVVSVFDGHK